jgi:hypothetical protein
MPYISSSIILQLLGAVVPYFEKLRKEGEEGQKKLTQLTRYGTVLISIVQSFAYSVFLMNMGASQGLQIVPHPGLRVHALDRSSPDHRHDLRDVAGREDHRARHRQRHLADHLRQHHRPRPERRAAGVQSSAPDAVASGAASIWILMVAVIAAVIADDPGDPQDPGAVRQAHRRAAACTAAPTRTSRCASTAPA